MDSANKANPYQNLLDHLDKFVELQGKCKDTSRKLEPILQTFIEAIKNNSIDKNCQDLKRTVGDILSKYERCRNFDACDVQDRIRIHVKDLELLMKEHDLVIREQELEKRDHPGRRQQHDSGYRSASSKTFTDSQCQVSSTNLETLVQSPSREQESSTSALVVSCSTYDNQKERSDPKGTPSNAEDDCKCASNNDSDLEHHSD